MDGNVSFYQVNLVSRITGEGGGGVLKDVGAWFVVLVITLTHGRNLMRGLTRGSNDSGVKEFV